MATTNEPAVPATNWVDAAVVNTGAVPTYSRKVCWVGAETPLRALITSGKTPARAGAVPEMVAVPLPLSVNVRPAGRAPSSDSRAVGEPLVVTVTFTAPPTGTTVDGLEVICSEATSTVNCVDTDVPPYVTVAVTVAMPLPTALSAPLRTATTPGRFEL